MNDLDALGRAIDRRRHALPVDVVRVSQGCRHYAPRLRQRIIRGRIYLVGEAGVAMLQRSRGAWLLRLTLIKAPHHVSWPADGWCEADEPLLVALLAAVQGCPPSALDSTCTGLRWLATKGGPSHG